MVLIYAGTCQDGLPDFEKLRENYKLVKKLIDSGKVLSTYAIGTGGLSSAISKMCFGNNIGFKFASDIKERVYLKKIMEA